VFVIDARFPATFIAKSEVRSWPVVGWLCTLVGTLYIERGKRSEARRARQIIAAELRRGTLVAVCPEGVTTFGRSLERFHSALFQPALHASATLQPVALRYLDAAGRHTDAAGAALVEGEEVGCDAQADRRPVPAHQDVINAFPARHLEPRKVACGSVGRLAFRVELHDAFRSAKTQTGHRVDDDAQPVDPA